jgi:hypothetical protein
MSEDTLNNILRDGLRGVLMIGSFIAIYATIFVLPNVFDDWRKQVTNNRLHQERMNDVELDIQKEKLRQEKEKKVQ